MVNLMIAMHVISPMFPKSTSSGMSCCGFSHNTCWFHIVSTRVGLFMCLNTLDCLYSINAAGVLLVWATSEAFYCRAWMFSSPLQTMSLHTACCSHVTMLTLRGAQGWVPYRHQQ